MLSLALVGGISLCRAKSGGNVLVIVADDLGKEVLSIYNTPAPIKAATPNINRLAEQGVVFDNVWGAPLSTPVRAAMLTGKQGHHTGVVALDIELPTTEKTLFSALPQEYTNAVIGKWHLCENFDFTADYGIDYFAGIAKEGGVRDYYRWLFTVNGESHFTTEYATTQITNSAKEWIEKQHSPWVCWVAYNAPHLPLHTPPSHMHSQDLAGTAADMEANPLPYYLAMVESLDYEIGRLLKSIDDNTTILFIGDNGSERRVLQPPYSPRHGKGSLYESGIAIPVIIAGADVTQEVMRCDALVSAVDIFPTVMGLIAEDMSSYEDGYSFVAAINGGETERRYNFSEILHRRQGYMNAVCDGRYKLITTQSGSEEFYNIEEDALEERNLLHTKLAEEQLAILNELRAELKRMNIPLDSLPTLDPNAGGVPGQRNRDYRSQRGGREQNRKKIIQRVEDITNIH